MNSVFADSFFYLAVLNKEDAAHEEALAPWNFEAFEQRLARTRTRRRVALWGTALSVATLAMVGVLALVTQPQMKREPLLETRNVPPGYLYHYFRPPSGNGFPRARENFEFHAFDVYLHEIDRACNLLFKKPPASESR